MRLITTTLGISQFNGAEMQGLIMQLENEWYRLK